ncbi:MAG: trimethylamine methyltransferase family protein [Chloroflexi bacterium]|nr:trimethylamine methyltransferase family protein [Chloroflexota bacterium]
MVTQGKHTPQFKALSSDGAWQIYSAALEVLNKVGIRFQHEEGQRLLQDGGASLASDGITLRIPTRLVERCLAQTPKKVLLAGRIPKNDLLLEAGGEAFFEAAGTSEFILDLETGERRPGRHEDTIQCLKLIDALSNVRIGPRCVVPREVPVTFMDIRIVELALENTGKHIAYSGQNLIQNDELVLKLSSLVVGGRKELQKRPLTHIRVSPVSPLVYGRDAVDKLFLATRWGVPLQIGSTPIAGGNGPITLAGSLVVATAETMAGIVLTQLAAPGTPVIFAGKIDALDLVRGDERRDALEHITASAGFIQIKKDCFGLPSYINLMSTEAVCPDGQTALKHGIGGLIAALAGANIIAKGGGFNEIFGIAKRLLMGIEVNEDTLALEAIERVGPGGNFLTDRHTLKHMRPTWFVPPLFNYDKWEVWQSKGAKDYVARAREKARELLREHQPAPLDEKLVQELRREVEAFEKEVQYA